MRPLLEAEHNQVYRRFRKPWLGHKAEQGTKLLTLFGLVATATDKALDIIAKTTDLDKQFTDRFGTIQIYPEPSILALTVAAVGGISWLAARRFEKGARNERLANMYLEQQPLP